MRFTILTIYHSIKWFYVLQLPLISLLRDHLNQNFSERFAKDFRQSHTVIPYMEVLDFTVI